MSGSPPLSPRQNLNASDDGKRNYGYTGQDVFQGTQAPQMEHPGQQRGPPLRAYAPDQSPYPQYRMEYMSQVQFQFPQRSQIPRPQQQQHLGYPSLPPQPPALYSAPDRPAIREAPDFSSSLKWQTKTRGHVSSACVPCKRAHLRCDARRPCSRCLSNGKEDSCVDVEHKKKGRPRLPKEAQYEGVGPSYSAPSDVSTSRPLSLFSPGEASMALSSWGPLHKSGSYRLSKSPEGPGPRDIPKAPRYSDHAFAANANIYGEWRGVQPQEPICAYLTMEMQVAKATASLSETIGFPSISSRRFQDIVIPNDREKVAHLQRGFEDERREREPNYLPPIYLDKFEEDRVIQSIGFSPEEIAGMILNRQEMFTFQGLDGQQRVFQVRFGLAKKEEIYFIVLMLQFPTTPQTFNPLIFPREPYSQDSQYKYQTLQQTHPPSQATSPSVALPFPVRDQRFSLPPLRNYEYQGPLSALNSFASKSSQHDSDAAPPSTGKIATEHLKSPSSVPPMESSHSRTNISSDYDDETDWDEDELSPSPQDIDPGNLSDGGKAFEERNLPLTKRKLVEDLMKEFWAIFNQEEEGNRTKAVVGERNLLGNLPSQDGASQQKSASSESLTELTPSGQGRQADRNKGKRRRDSQDSQNDDDRDDRNRKRPRPLLFPPMKEDDNTKFACPYRKHNPQKYCVQYWRSCALTPLETVARVKEHLYKHHRIFPCQRCKALFQDQQKVNQHLNEPKGCELVEIDQADGVTSEIVERLRSRKKAYKGQTEEERWEEIYKLLFPDEIAPSPYYDPVQEDMQSPDSRALAEYEQYCRRELPRYFRASLEEMIDKEAQPFEENIRSQLMSMIRDCQDRVFSTYRAAATPALQRSTINTRKSPPLAVRSFTPQDMRYDSFEPAEDREHSSEILLPVFLEPPAPQSHLTSRLESTNSHGQAPPHAENNLSDSGYISDIRPLLSENLGQNVMISTSQPSQSHPTSEGLCTQRPSTQRSSNFETTAPDIQRSDHFFNNSGDVRNTPRNSWIGDFDPSMMLDGDEWGQFVGMDPTLDPPA